MIFDSIFTTVSLVTGGTGCHATATHTAVVSQRGLIKVQTAQSCGISKQFSTFTHTTTLKFKGKTNHTFYYSGI